MPFDPDKDPERFGLPSASSYARLVACPGSFALERQCPPDAGDADSKHGDRVHAALALNDPSGLDDDEFRTYTDALEINAGIIADWRAHFDPDGTGTEIREERLLLRRKLVPIFSGQADYIAINHQETAALCIDYKSLFGSIPDATENLQIEAIAVLAKARWPKLTSFSGVINQPRITRHPKRVEFDAAAMQAALLKLVGVLAAAEQPDAPLNPGPSQCHYCRAKGICPAFLESADAQLAILGTKSTSELDEPTKAVVRKTLAGLSGEELARYTKARRLLSFVENAIEQETKRRLNADEIVPGYFLKPGNRKVTIADTARAAENLVGIGMPQTEIIACSTLSITKLTDSVRLARGVTRDAARAQVEEALADELVINQNAPSLSEVKS